MKRILIILAILIWPVTAYGALLPQPTGSCPKICLKWGMNLTAGALPKCEIERTLVCNLGKCVEKEDTTPTEDDAPCNYTLDDILQSAVNFVTLILGMAGSLALLMLAYGGYQMLISMGNPEGINKAKGTIVGAFIGLILILGAVAFVQFGGIIVGGKVKTTGEVEFGVAACGDKAKDGDACGDDNSMVCWKGACISLCEQMAATENELYGYTCQPLLGELNGQKQQICVVKGQPICPGEENGSVGCCITVGRAEAVKKMQEQAK